MDELFPKIVSALADLRRERYALKEVAEKGMEALLAGQGRMEKMVEELRGELINYHEKKANKTKNKL